MKSMQQLETEARDRRTQFAATLRDVQSRLTLPGLADEALRQFDPYVGRLPPALLTVKRHPLLAAGALAGAGWLFKQVLGTTRKRFKNGRDTSHNRTRVRPPITSTLKKESNHEID
jgi:hypothetical protein